MALTDVKIRQTSPADKSFRLYDTEGLYLEIAPSGSRLWRLKYRVEGKEKRLALGRYPEVPLRQARAERDAAREMIRKGQDPVAVRKAKAGEIAAEKAHAFETVARGWHELKSATWAPGHAHRLMHFAPRHVAIMAARSQVNSIYLAGLIYRRVNRHPHIF